MTSPIYRWRVGEVEITRVVEFEAGLFEPAVIHPTYPLISLHGTGAGWSRPYSTQAAA
jgi:hypothetical protein